MVPDLTARSIVMVSPHPDDVCFSIAGVAATTQVGHLVTVCTRSAFITGPPWRANADEVTRARTTEDVLFCAQLGLRRHPLGHPDTSVRSTGADMRDAAGDENAMVACIADQLAAVLAELSDPLCLAPLGIGGHIDHEVAREGAIRAAANTGAAIGFYEDLPYLLEVGTALAEVFAAQVMDSPVAVDHVSALTLVDKLALMDGYRSQVSNEVRRAVRARSAQIVPHPYLAERLWFAAEETAPGGRST